jgi:hypothetical protein
VHSKGLPGYLPLIIRMVRLDYIGFFRSPKWLILPVALCFITWVQGTKVLRAASAAGLTANIWDAVASVMLNRYAIWYFMTPICLYLLNDLILDRGFGPAFQLRTLSRGAWWTGKVVATGGLTLMAGVVSLGTSVLVSALMLPWDSNWSAAARSGLPELPIAPVLLAHAPAIVALGACALMTLGWLLLTLVGAVATLHARHSLVGLSAGFSVYFAGVAIDVLTGVNRFSQWLPHQHFVLNEIASRAGRLDLITILGSTGYLICLSAAIITLGFGKVHDHDFPVAGG